ncbi:MAG: DUF3570 domain-containing protein [Verrucomicrobia bacterium]|nr:DUF3570 domain-containing protein [Verrucomicrobiota bacterium]
MALAFALLLLVLRIQRAQAEDQVNYRYEYYQEDDQRIQVQTQSMLFDVTLKEGLVSVAGELVHDAVSGATPSGAPPPNQWYYPFGSIGDTNSAAVPLQHMEDKRNSISLQVPVTLGINSITPQFAYSEESDYKSTGAALNYSLSLFEKNTILTFGWAHTWDQVLDAQPIRQWQDKSGDDFLIGCNQLLSPKTVLGLNFTFGLANGYLNDPYRLTFGVNDPQFSVSDPSGGPEQRPDYRNKAVVRASITQFITPANASVEGAYRYYHDTYGINAHTVELAWYQNLGKHVVLSPMFRYYYQSEAAFYYEILPDTYATAPAYFSPDWRLSQMQTFTAGINLAVKATKWLTFDASYKRYITQGLDGITSQTAYPAANVFTIGARILF